jgi:hypothetical protein
MTPKSFMHPERVTEDIACSPTLAHLFDLSEVG